MSNWLPITEYSLKNGVSISTIRRKIKNKILQYKINNGKYYILDEDADYEISENRLYLKEQSFANVDELISFAEKSITTVSKLSQDLLDEKDKVIKIQENMILQLREQSEELKMLVSVLEKSL